MPIYDFQCTSCNFKDELMRKSSEANTILCPKCSQETFSKMLSAPSFQLSGSGWYATDFKDKKVNKTEDSTKASTTEAPAANCAPGCACH
jgi:putative FmdB family regulatory protein